MTWDDILSTGTNDSATGAAAAEEQGKQPKKKRFCLFLWLFAAINKKSITLTDCIRRHWRCHKFNESKRDLLALVGMVDLCSCDGIMFCSHVPLCVETAP